MEPGRVNAGELFTACRRTWLSDPEQNVNVGPIKTQSSKVCNEQEVLLWLARTRFYAARPNSDDGDHQPRPRRGRSARHRLDGARLGRVFVERQVPGRVGLFDRPPFVVVLDIS